MLNFELKKSKNICCFKITDKEKRKLFILADVKKKQCLILSMVFLLLIL